MQTEIREYNPSDQEFLSAAMTILQQYLVGLDPNGTMLCPPDCGVPYAEELIQKVQQGDGRIAIAFIDDEPVGVVVGVIKHKSGPTSKITTEGEVLELFVVEEHRGLGIGSQLMQWIEEFFRLSGCEVVSVAVFAPNVEARDLYKRLGYSNRVISLRKALE